MLGNGVRARRDRSAPAPAETAIAALRDKTCLATVADDTTACKALVQELVETITVNGRDDIVPVYRYPSPAATDQRFVNCRG